MFLIWASFTSNAQGNFDMQDGTTSVGMVKTEIRGATRDGVYLTPHVPIPISSAGADANFVLDATASGRLSVCYGYGI